jgi:uncharacterized membrane protein YwzB
MNPALTNVANPVWAIDGLVFMAFLLAATYMVWWALGVVRWDKFLFDPFGPQARWLRFILALIGGFLVALCLVCYLLAAQLLRQL